MSKGRYGAPRIHAELRRRGYRHARKPLKGECLDQQPWPTRAAARRATVKYIAWYNGTRLHSALGYMTPDEFETATNEEALTQVA